LDIPRAPTKNRKPYIYGGVALVVVVVTTVALGSLKPAAPTVERGTIWPDKVKRGAMVRQVRGPGSLVPEQIRWISALTAGRVERVLLRPGTAVKTGTVLLELSNPDVQLQLLDAERQLTAAEAELVNLRTSLATQRLNQQGVVATARAESQNAKRSADAAVELARQGLISTIELGRLTDKAEELAERLDIEQQRLRIISDAIASQLGAQEAQVKRLQAIVQFRRNEIASMIVRAGTDGMLQDLPLEMGQWVQSGATLAKVVQPGRLKAVLRIPETQAKDVTLGQTAEIDTRNGIIHGRVVRIDPASQTGTVGVDVALEGELPAGARPDLSVDGTIEIERLPDVLFVGRPAFGQASSSVSLFKVEPGGKSAIRVTVKLGRSSVNTIEIVEGLAEGDEVILSDMSRWDGFDRVRLQ
jgi:multidrug resistance efflux pump